MTSNGSGVALVADEDHPYINIFSAFRKTHDMLSVEGYKSHVTLRLFDYNVDENMLHKEMRNLEPIELEFIGLHKSVYNREGTIWYFICFIPSPASIHKLERMGYVIDTIYPNGYLKDSGYHLTLIHTPKIIGNFDTLGTDLKLQFPFTMRFSEATVLSRGGVPQQAKSKTIKETSYLSMLSTWVRSFLYSQ